MLNEAKRAETEHTFENVATAWFELKKDSVTPAYAEDIWRSLTPHVFPELRTTPLAEITAPMVIGVLRPIEAKGSLETVKGLSQRLNEIMTYGVDSGKRPAKSPTKPLQQGRCSPLKNTWTPLPLSSGFSCAKEPLIPNPLKPRSFRNACIRAFR